MAMLMLFMVTPASSSVKDERRRPSKAIPKTIRDCGCRRRLERTIR